MKKKYLTACIEFKCNSNCVHCMIRDGINKYKALKFNDFKKLIKNKFKKEKYDGLILSGAEPTLNKQLVEFIKYAKKSGIDDIELQTNGRRFCDKEFCTEIINAGANKFFISLLGDDAKVHESLTIAKGSFEETLIGLKNLDSLNAELSINIIATKVNYTRLDKIANLASSIHKVNTVHFWNYWPMDGSDKCDLLVPLKEIVPHLIKAIDWCLENNKNVVVKNFPPCILGTYERFVDNSQPDTIIDDRYWKEHEKNQWGCLFVEGCEYAQSVEGCGKGCLSAAYINKFGWDDSLLEPTKTQVKIRDNGELNRYLTHNKKFKTKSSIYSKLFERLMLEVGDFRLENSIKASGNDIFSARHDLWLNDKRNFGRGLDKIFVLLRRLNNLPGVSLNYEIIKKFFDRNFRLDKVKEVCCGIDLRKNTGDSRVKLWFIIKDYPRMYNKIVKEGKIKVQKPFSEDELLFGVDFYFDGRTRLKIYPSINVEEVKDSSLRGIFTEEVASFVKSCSKFYVSFDEEGNRILHFRPRATGEFVKQLGNRKLKEVSKHVEDIGGIKMISVLEKEINKGKITRFNVYY